MPKAGLTGFDWTFLQGSTFVLQLNFSAENPAFGNTQNVTSKAMTIEERINYHLENKKYCKVKRQVTDGCFEYSNGYIVDTSSDFVLMQISDEFRILGYLVFPMKTVTEVRFNNNDKYYDKIMQWEKQVDNVLNKHNIDLKNWSTIFKTIEKTGLNVIIENENPDDKSFDIGPITKTNKKTVYVHYFNAKGYLEAEPTEITFDKITIVKFDDHYANIFGKYLRERKSK